MTEDEERWAEAAAIHRLHGEHAPLHVAARIGALAHDGDLDGVERWIRIASRIDLIMRTEEQ